jgi:hypothetical protein
MPGCKFCGANADVPADYQQCVEEAMPCPTDTSHTDTDHCPNIYDSCEYRHASGKCATCTVDPECIWCTLASALTGDVDPDLFGSCRSKHAKCKIGDPLTPEQCNVISSSSSLASTVGIVASIAFVALHQS